jgi:hypothetical protein
VRAQASASRTSGINPKDTIPEGQTMKEYLVPSTQEEHIAIVNKLKLGCSLRHEVEQIILNRKSAHNKAYKNHRKSLMKPKRSNKKKNSSCQSSPASQILHEHGTKSLLFKFVFGSSKHKRSCEKTINE